MKPLSVWSLAAGLILAAGALATPVSGGTIEYFNGGTGIALNVYTSGWTDQYGANWGNTASWVTGPFAPLTVADSSYSGSARGDLSMNILGDVVHIHTSDWTQIDAGGRGRDVTSGYIFAFMLDEVPVPTTLYYQLAYDIQGAGAADAEAVRLGYGGVAWNVSVPPAIGGVDARILSRPGWWTTGANVIGSFSDVGNGNLSFGLQTAATGVSANITGDFWITISDQPISNVPEPASAILLGSAVLAAGCLARRFTNR